MASIVGSRGKELFNQATSKASENNSTEVFNIRELADQIPSIEKVLDKPLSEKDLYEGVREVSECLRFAEDLQNSCIKLIEQNADKENPDNVSMKILIECIDQALLLEVRGQIRLFNLKIKDGKLPVPGTTLNDAYETLSRHQDAHHREDYKALREDLASAYDKLAVYHSSAEHKNEAWIIFSNEKAVELRSK